MQYNPLPIVIFDIDGTLSLMTGREKYIEQYPKDWDAFYDEVDTDILNPPVFDILTGLSRIHKYLFVYLTSRRSSSREKTMQWFDKVGIPLQPENLIMRAENDYRPDTIVKPELVAHLMPRIVMAFEDRASMAAKWRELGITCLQVAEGNF